MKALYFGRYVVAFVAILMVGGCGDDPKDPVDPGGITTKEANFVYGKLVSADKGLGVRNATVTLGTYETTSNDQGYFAFTDVNGIVTMDMTVVANGYAPAYRAISLAGKATQFVEIAMAGWEVTEEFDHTAEASIPVDGATISIPANSYTGNGPMTAKIAYINTGLLEDTRRALPGDGRNAAGDSLLLRGGVYLQVEDSEGNIRSLENGQPLFTMPSNGGGENDLSWRFDAAKRGWVTAGKVNCASGNCVITADSDGWWSAGLAFEPFCGKIYAADQFDNAVNGVFMTLDEIWNEQLIPDENIAQKTAGVGSSGFTIPSQVADNRAVLCTHGQFNSDTNIVARGSGWESSFQWATPQDGFEVDPDYEEGSLSCGGALDDFCDENPILTTPLAQVQAVLTWGRNPRDLDLHITGPCPEGMTKDCDEGRFDVGFKPRGSVTSAPYVYVDTVDLGEGPEIASIYKCDASGSQFRVYVHNVSGTPSIEVAGLVVYLRTPDGMVTRIPGPTTNVEGQSYQAWVAADINCSGNAAGQCLSCLVTHPEQPLGELPQIAHP